MAANIRKTRFIDPAVQGALRRRILLHWLAFVGISLAMTLCMYWLSEPFDSFGELLSGAFWKSTPIYLTLLCLLPAFVLDTIKLSARFAGPMHRLQRAMHDAAHGKTPQRVVFRGDDYWQQLAIDFNAVLDKLSVNSAAGEAGGE